ncbi:MAG: hypothetical protein FJX52_16930, partial [Alphaproteobacteria bacterium]|nr:hypothetical protein [Alphaproteobacteria bacterium]
DILISLGGHTGENRVLVCAYKPAPVQASYGDLTTTGLATMDYWLTDPVLHPPGTRERFTEILEHLPLLVVHRPPGDAALAPAPSFQSGRVTFGSFNNPAKLTPPTIATWARILAALPNSALMLHFYDVFGSGSTRRRFLEAFAAQGVSGQRLIFESGLLDRASHLRLYDRVDIALDPFPFTGCTTTFEALWMGVPVVTLAGERWLGRMTAGILAPIGLDEFITENAAAYVRKALELAGQADRRAQLRVELRERLRRSSLCDYPTYARSVERAYSSMWRRWCGAHGHRI